MFERFINLLSQYSTLSKKEIEYLKQVKDGFQLRTLKKNEVLIKEGNIIDSMYFLLDGCIRLFYNVNGIEKTAFFYTPGNFIRSFNSYRLQIPTQRNYQAIEDSVVINIQQSLLKRSTKNFSGLLRIAHIAVEQELRATQNIIYSFITKSPEERYLELIKTNRELFLNVNQYYIASYLGIAAESLSRMRKRILFKKKT